MTEPACYPESRDACPGSGAPHTASGATPMAPASQRGLLPTPRSKWRPINLLWLVYTGFFFIDPIQQGSRRDWLILAGVYPCFLALYVLFVWVRPVRTRQLLLLAMAALGCAYYPMNNSAGGCMFIYVASLAPFATTSLIAAAAMIIAAALASAAEGFLLHLNPWTWGTLSVVAVSVAVGNLLIAMRTAANQRLFIAQEQVEHLAKIAERERIARDLHDVLGHTLSLVVLKSELAGKLIDGDVERARREIGDVEQITRQALAEVREAIRGYRAEGMAAEIARARRTLDAAGVRLEWQGSGQEQSLRLEPAHESVLSLVLREAVTNILRHAGATSCRLELAADSRGTHLSLHDNGRGASEYNGNGLRGMRERVKALGGRLEIDYRQGTRLAVAIPARARP